MIYRLACRRSGRAAIAVLMTIAMAPFARADAPSAPAAVDAVRGKIVYQVCMGCHSVDEDDVGPRHRGVVGRVAGSVVGYPYSPALRNAGFKWDAAALDKWLTNPQGLVPGTKMFFMLSNAQDRADVIAYLSGLK